MVKKRGLGKSLDALLSYPNAETRQSVEILSKNNSPAQETLQEIHVDLLTRGKYQPRRNMDPQSLEELAHSIRHQGVIQPLIARPSKEAGKNKYEIIAGERRWQAAKLAGLSSVPVIVRHIPDKTAMAIGLIENIQRENLNPIEEAEALERLIREFGMTHQEVADAVGKSRTAVTNLLRLRALPDTIKEMIANGLIEMGHARTLITLPAHQQLEVAQRIVAQELSVRETENVIRHLQNPKKPSENKPADPDIVHLQEKLSRQLNMRVSVACNAKGKGKVVIHYRTLRELDQLLAKIGEHA
ncbi:MAG TPA: ParB/RepB/Spo0J family partition protein [Gammaproteobacteria bacterium]|jgi:ParB family chromosome partitioning protein|nr:ParB/RepB/Spo0J family partition protein [Gammaproteobacteria bacterium]